MRVISLYTGAGGLDLGFEAAGFETVVSVEKDPRAAETIMSNRPQWGTIIGDIHDITSEFILAQGRIEVGEAALLVGGPPCQPFSKSAYWIRGDTRRLDDPRASTLEQFLRVLRDARPVGFLLENVPGLGYNGKDEGLDLLLKTLDDINEETGTDYQASVAVLNSAAYGVPQERRRLFVVGHREGIEFEFPASTHGVWNEEHLAPEPLHPITTAWDAIGDLEEEEDPELKVTGSYADLLPSIPEGQNYLYHTPRGDGIALWGWRTRYWSFLLKLAKCRPSWTITAQPGPAVGPFHWKNRKLSVREFLRLQTFPEGYTITGGRTTAQRQLGNAVPAALAERLGLEIRSQFFGGPKLGDQSLTLLPTWRRPIPPPEPLGPVPAHYRRQVKDHPPHPGIGLGPGAQLR